MSLSRLIKIGYFVLAITVILALLFCLGLVLALLYSTLSGGIYKDFAYMLFLSPLVLVLLVLSYFCGAINRKRRTSGEYFPPFQKWWRKNWIFWAVVACVSLPICFNWLSMFFVFLGEPLLGQFLFRWRYTPLFALPLVIPELVWCLVRHTKQPLTLRTN